MKQPTKPAKETAVYDPPAIADAIPLEAGVERQSDFSRHVQLVYDAHDWSVATLLSWVIWRDQNRICKISHYSDWRATVRYGAEDGMNAMAAWRMVLMALKNGELVAIEDGVPLAAEHWYGVKANSKKRGTVLRRNMHFGRESVLNPSLTRDYRDQRGGKSSNTPTLKRPILSTSIRCQRASNQPWLALRRSRSTITYAVAEIVFALCFISNIRA